MQKLLKMLLTFEKFDRTYLFFNINESASVSVRMYSLNMKSSLIYNTAHFIAALA